MKRARLMVGDVIQITLPSGKYAYGRMLRSGVVAFYRAMSTEPGKPPIGSRDYQFVVGVNDDVVRSERCPVVGHDPSRDAEDDEPPPGCVRDPITGKVKIYHKGEMRPATEEECQDLEPVAAWAYHHIIDRLRVGEVIQLALPNGTFAYGRMLRESAVAFYRAMSVEPGKPPIGSRDYQFVVRVNNDVVQPELSPVVGYDPSQDVDDQWPPPFCVRRISGQVRLYHAYHKGVLRPATEEECRGLEPTAERDFPYLVDRLLKPSIRA